MNGFVIAIDGPVASGKGTIAELIARQLDGFHFSTGLTYRALAYHCLQEGIDTSKENAVEKGAKDIQIQIVNGEVLLNNQNITSNLFKNEVSKASSDVAVYADVRKRMVQIQQGIIQTHTKKGHVVVVDGRDIGTKVWPEAEVKIFLTADPTIRANRRLSQLSERGEKKTLEEVIVEVNKRDKNDTERAVDPLAKEPEKHGYVILDNSTQSEEETLGMIENILRERM